MSHFVTVVILPETNSRPTMEQAEAAVGGLLEPYNENTEVSEYERACWCIGSGARAAWTQDPKLDCAAFEQLRSEFTTKHRNSLDRERELRFDEKAKEAFEGERKALSVELAEVWSKMVDPLVKAREEAEKRHPLYGKPTPDCETCKGTGREKTTYNPKSQWDWWVVGGRWSEWMPATTLKASAFLVGEADGDKIPFAIVTPDGEWHQKGKMGWWGMTSDEISDDEWAKQASAILAQYGDNWSVVCDLHI